MVVEALLANFAYPPCCSCARRRDPAERKPLLVGLLSREEERRKPAMHEFS